MMRLASALLILTMVTTCAISGTFAKYVTEDSGSDSARVAKFGVTVDVTVQEGTDDAFTKTYAKTTEAEDKDGNVIENTVVSTVDVLAPGTGGTLLKQAKITGTPEVAVNVKKEATLTLTGWDVDGAYYCPLTITVDGTPYYGLSYASAAEFIEAVEGALESNVNYEPNTNLNADQSVTWAWAFEGTDSKQTDELDTKLGDYAANTGDIKIAFEYKVTVTQID